MNDLGRRRCVETVDADDADLCDSAPPASSCRRTVAASGGSSWWQLVHQAPKNNRTAGAPLPPPSAGTDTWLGPAAPMLAA